MAGNIVHKTPFSVNPYSEESNKPTKIYSYVWKLYKTERSSYISPGTYEIVVGGMYKPNSTAGKLTTIIMID